MATAEDLQRQIAIAVVVAMEEAALLFPMQRCRGAGQVFHLRGCRLQCRIVAQFLVVIEVFIPQGKGAESLPHECQCGVIAARLAARVGQCFGDCGSQTQLLIDLRQEGRPP